MYDKKELDSMAQRYKDEMMKLYRQQQSAGKVITRSVPQAEKTEIKTNSSGIVQKAEPLTPVYKEAVNEKKEIGFITKESEESSKNEQEQNKKDESVVNPSSQVELSENQESEKADEKIRETTEFTKDISENIPQLNKEILNNEMQADNENDEYGIPDEPDIDVPPEVREIMESKSSAEKNESEEPLTETGEIIFDTTVPNTADTDYDETVPNTGTGYLKVEVSVADQALPIPDATVVISRRYKEGDVLIGSLVTNESGETDTINLPTPPKSFSEQVGNTTIEPYAEYVIKVKADGFYPEENLVVPVFDTILSIQPFQLVPLPKNTPKMTSEEMTSD